MSIINRRGQTGAIIESIDSNACDAVGDSHRGQTDAIRESLHSNAGDAVAHGYGGQFAAINESIVSNACGTVFDDDGFNGTARGIPWCIIWIFEIIHNSGAGDGEGTIAGELPSQVVALCATRTRGDKAKRNGLNVGKFFPLVGGFVCFY